MLRFFLSGKLSLSDWLYFKESEVYMDGAI
jgi:hypothetical protein